MTLLTRFRIWRLKRKAVDAYHRSQVPSYMDCGWELADHIKGGTLSAARTEFEDLMTQLRALDPNAPKR